MDRYSIDEAAKKLGVSISTLRRWEKEGRLVAERTSKGHRRYR
ncbi:MAG: MerR family DNA-binding transcriptional regulator, partial [Duodenibacillus sp.]|nr:MerR family DNA-binding transcriptional regulator [Duodenibacillus sp.]